MEALRPVVRARAGLVELLDRREALRAALELLAAEGDVAWIAEPAGAPGEDLVLHQVHGDLTGVLRGLRVHRGLGLTGKVYGSGAASWVNDYFGAADITHTFDGHIAAEGVRRLMAVPVLRSGQVLGVLAVGARSDGAFGERSLHRTSAIADEVSVAVAVAERVRLAREVAVHEERRRVAADLHDSVGALLFAIGSGVAGIAENATGDPELVAQLDRLQRQAVEASVALRDSLRTLRATPSALALSVALRGDCNAFSDRTGIPAELVVLDDELPVLSPTRTDVLLAAVREALLNVEKHAQASAVAVTLSAGTSGGIVAAVTDDGVGLPVDHVRGVGLTTTAEAVGRLGGVLKVTSEAHAGTTWRAEVSC
jgi:signal transduction histidine kinase